MSNPFVIDAMYGRPRPLQPWRADRADDRKFYVPVDDTEEQFRAFTEALPHPRILLDEGRLVLVTGHVGCGKTSLVNRCARWAKDHLDVEGLKGTIVDLTQEVRQNESVDTRQRKVFERLVDELGQYKLIDVAAKADLLSASPQDAASRGYPLLRNILPQNAVVIILLPPSGDLMDEIREYARLARQRILFFAESSYAQDMAGLSLSTPGAAPVIQLKVGLISQDDGWNFVTNRLQNYQSGGVPDIPRDAVHRMIVNWTDMNLSTLELILWGVFDRAIANSVSNITYEDIGDYVIKWTSEQRGKDGRQ